SSLPLRLGPDGPGQHTAGLRFGTVRRHLVRNAAATVAVVGIGIATPLTITRGNEITGGNATLIALWAVVGASILIWFLSTDLVRSRPAGGGGRLRPACRRCPSCSGARGRTA